MYYSHRIDEKHPFHVAEYWGGGLGKTETDEVLHHGEDDGAIYRERN